MFGLRCCTRALSSCGKQGLLLVAVRGPPTAVASPVAEHRLQAHGLQQSWLMGSRAQAQQPWRMGLFAPQHVGSSRTRARTRVPCIGRQIPNHCTTREVPVLYILIQIAKILFAFLPIVMSKVGIIGLIILVNFIEV